jgi:catechol 2,3-dioxygenase-like lactoylglutathione lyase family enzyme
VARAHHHHGLLVADLERAAGFYVEAFDGRRLTGAVPVRGRAAAAVMGGPPGTRFELCLVGFEAGAVELFAFAGDDLPDWVAAPQRGRLPHLGMEVEDVPAVLARVEAAGGRRLWEDVGRWGAAHVIYVADPDGNVIELLDAPIETIAAEALRLFPEATP